MKIDYQCLINQFGGRSEASQVSSLFCYNKEIYKKKIKRENKGGEEAHEKPESFYIMGFLYHKLFTVLQYNNDKVNGRVESHDATDLRWRLCYQTRQF